MSNSLTFNDFAFDLPQELFKNDSFRSTNDIRLIVVDSVNETIKHDMFRNVTDYFDQNDLLVFNDSGITPSRLTAKLENGECIDICFLMKSLEKENQWETIVLYEDSNPIGNIFDIEGVIKGKVIKKTLDFDGGYWVEKDRYKGFRGFVEINVDEVSLRKLLNKQGKLMHPWYADLNNLKVTKLNPYMSSRTGSVLLSEPSRRITKEMIDIMNQKGVTYMKPTLNMSFSWQLVYSEQKLEDYHMNYEEFRVEQEDIDILEKAVKENKRIVSVGTSGARILESLDVPPKAVNSRTNIFIAPGHKFKYTDCLLTNLHNSMGTHVVMASAFANRELVLEACNIAVKDGYRFGIYGDSMLVLGDHKCTK